MSRWGVRIEFDCDDDQTAETYTDFIADFVFSTDKWTNQSIEASKVEQP